MILPGNAALVLSAVTQLIKLRGRIDGLLAQRTAVESSLVLGMPRLQLASISAQIALVQKTLQDTAATQPDPFGADRAALQQQVSQGQPDASFDALFAKYFPDAANGLVVSPDADYLTQLQQTFPGLNWSDPAVRIAAFAIAAGNTDQQISYTARIALAVADTLFEFGGENTSLLVRDPKLQGVVQTVLQRFAQPDWSSFTQWNPLLQTALRVTLNAALDVGEKLPPDNPWLGGVLDALSQARSASKQPDNYLAGLLQGEGLQLFLAKGLLVASNKLDDAQAGAFQQVAADVLKAAAPMVEDETRPDFADFFNNHWGDLLRAGLTSLDNHGPAILQGENPLLRDSILAIVKQLSTTPDAGFLSSETLYQLADTAIGVVAANPGEITGLDSKPWLRDFLAAAAQTAKQLTVKKLFTPEAAEALVLDAVGVLAKYPTLVIKQQGLPLAIATDIFTAVSKLTRLDGRTIGQAALQATLTALSTDPTLAAGNFGPAVTAVAGTLADLVGKGALAGTDAAGIATAAINAIASNPQVYSALQKDIASAVVGAVQRNVKDNAAAPWAGRMLVQLVQQTLTAVARNGGPAASSKTAADFEQFIGTVVNGSLTLAANQLGSSVDLDGIPPVLGGILAQALRGDLTVFDPASPQFAAAFKALAAALPATKS